MTDLDKLLTQIRGADRSTRIGFRDSLAAHGAAAIEPLRTWLSDAELGAFAVRVLHEIAQDPACKRQVVGALSEGRSDPASPTVLGDIERELVILGQSLTRAPARVRAPSAPRSTATRTTAPTHPAKPGRRYWAMRTSDTRPNLIWAEIRRGKLRQGWGRSVEEDLRVIEAAMAAGRPLSTPQTEAWRAYKMLGASQDGVSVDDLIVTQNLPEVGRLSVCRVVGPYAFAFPDSIFDYGHILPVELVVEDVSRADPAVSDALRRAVSLRPRLYEITQRGGDVESLLAAAGPASDPS